MNIPYSKLTNAEEAFAAVKKNLTPEIIAKFQVKADVTYDAAKMLFQATGAGFTLKIYFLDKEAKVDLDVSFLLRPLKGKILHKIEKLLISIL